MKRALCLCLLLGCAGERSSAAPETVAPDEREAAPVVEGPAPADGETPVEAEAIPEGESSVDGDNPFENLPTQGEAESDPWITEVKTELNNLELPAEFAAAEGTFKFRLEFCRDGGPAKVQTRGGTASPELKIRLLEAIGAIEFPPIPEEHAGSMQSECQVVPVLFTYEGGRVR